MMPKKLKKCGWLKRGDIEIEKVIITGNRGKAGNRPDMIIRDIRCRKDRYTAGVGRPVEQREPHDKGKVAVDEKR